MTPQDALSVANEIRAAEQTALLHHAPIRKMIAQYCSGKWYRDDLVLEPTPENHVFAYVDWMEPQLAYSAPSAIVEANWEKTNGDVAKWMEACQQRATACYPITEDFRLWVLDILFGYGVMKVCVEQVQGKPQPTLMHVPMDQWGCATGPGINKLSECPIQYHRYDVDMDDLAAMRDIDPEALTMVKNTYEANGDKRGVGVPGTKTADRQRARVYDVWFGDQRMIGTLLSAGREEPTTTWLRPPMHWAGPESGPFVVCGLKRVQGSPYPMSPLMAVMQQIEKLNAHLRADATEADSMKTIWGVDAASTEAGKDIEQAKSGAIVYIQGLKNGVVQKMDLGGVHAGRLEHTNQMLERVERFLSMGDAIQGISNSDTATANSIAAKSANVRVEYARSLVNEAAAVALKGQMWYRFNDPAYEERISVMQTQTDPDTGVPTPSPVEGYFQGGTQGGFYRGEFFPPQTDLDWERDFTVMVDGNSTSHTSDVQKLQDATTLLQVQQTAWNMLNTMPGADVEYTVNRIGEAMNIRNLFKSLFTAQMVAMAQAGNPMPPVQIPPGASPAMGPGLAGMGRFGPLQPPTLPGGVGPGATPTGAQSRGMAGGLAAGPALGASFGGKRPMSQGSQQPVPQPANAGTYAR